MRALCKCCAVRGSVAAIAAKQVKGEIKIEEVHSTGDDDDYVYSATVEGSGDAQVGCRAVNACMHANTPSSLPEGSCRGLKPQWGRRALGQASVLRQHTVVAAHTPPQY